MSKPLVWGCCDQEEYDKDFIKCSSCKKVFHFKCICPSDPIEDYRNQGSYWKCPLCRPKKSKDDSTPVRDKTGKAHITANITKRSNKRPALYSPPQQSMTSISHDDLREVVREVLKAENSEMLQQLKSSLSSAFNAEVKSLKAEVQDIKDSITFMNAQYEAFQKIKEAEKDSVSNLILENSKLQKTVLNLNERIEQLEHQTRACNLELQCIPESRSENVFDIVSRIGDAIGCKIQDEKISRCTRTAKQDRSNPRPRSIIAQFSTAKVRDSFLAAAINFNRNKNIEDKLNTSHIGLGNDRKPIYIAEHLSPQTKIIHAASRIKAKEIGYKYVWVRNGKVLMRKNDGADLKIIKNLAYLDKLS
ncbi:unnamed protein product [Colias eurytheme]|nr:unnamed protein product [Colias eurytheme]